MAQDLVYVLQVAHSTHLRVSLGKEGQVANLIVVIIFVNLINIILFKSGYALVVFHS